MELKEESPEGPAVVPCPGGWSEAAGRGELNDCDDDKLLLPSSLYLGEENKLPMLLVFLSITLVGSCFQI